MMVLQKQFLFTDTLYSVACLAWRRMLGLVRGIVTHPASPSRNVCPRVSPSTGLCTAAGPLQLTLAILKPDLVQHPPNLRQVHRIIIEQDFLVIRSKEPSNNDINQA